LGVRNTALFAHTPGVRAPLSSTQRASFSVRRDPSTYSPAAFTERWNDVPSRDDGSAEPCLQVGWRCMIPASDEAGVPQQGGIFVKAIASRREDSRYSSDTAQSRGHKWVTAIHLNSRGFAFVVFEGPLAPRDWSIVEARGEDKREKILARIDALFARYRPDVVVLQDMSQTGTHRPHRIRRLNEAIVQAAERYGFPVAFFSRVEVRQRFTHLGSVTKGTIAASISKHSPAPQKAGFLFTFRCFGRDSCRYGCWCSWRDNLWLTTARRNRNIAAVQRVD
jgi:hypothetical protein